MKKALITGVYGQDGSYLSEILHNENYEIYGICREQLSESSKHNKIELEREGIHIKECCVSLHDYDAVGEMIKEIQPDVAFHLAAIHHSSSSSENNSILAEKQLYDLNILATGNLLANCYEHSPYTRVVTAGSCLMYDDSKEVIQDEQTKYSSKSMYGLAKIAEKNLVNYYRKKGFFACVSILYNHESHRRPPQFVTKKIANGMKAISRGELETLELGDINVKKDWGFAGDYAMAMKLMSEAEAPKDYIISSGELHTIEEYIELCAKELGINDWRSRVVINQELVTRKISATLCGNSQKCISELGWKRTMNFHDLVKEMLRDEEVKE